ncbi:MAG TPA: dihydroneopterin aldolase [Chitinophagaceae bacterium]|nr:dihydroneopterin aldolase [Chitinophagaceae bacterium]
MDITTHLSTIRIEKLHLRAYIGFMKWETEKLQDVLISYSFKYDTQRAATTDDVEYAINYKKITKAIIEMVDGKSFHLIERMAEEIYDYIKTFSPKIESIKVKVEKPHALRFSDNVLVEISSKDRYNKAIIGMGSNIDPENNFSKALDCLQDFVKIIQRSDFIMTKPLKFEEQADFLNGAILVLTKKSLSELKMELKQIEARLGRVRQENKNAPRCIDLDVVSFNDFMIDESDLEELPFLVDLLEQLEPQNKNTSQ